MATNIERVINDKDNDGRHPSDTYEGCKMFYCCRYYACHHGGGYYYLILVSVNRTRWRTRGDTVVADLSIAGTARQPALPLTYGIVFHHRELRGKTRTRARVKETSARRA